MITIDFTEEEKNTIRGWYETVQDKAGHFGDGQATFPDDDIILGKIKCSGPCQFTEHHLGVIILWAEQSLKGSAITPEEHGLLTKIMYQTGRSVDELGIIKSKAE